jgi:pyruvate/2-oxoglutarate/acetoin dehydrogenase E1 component
MGLVVQGIAVGAAYKGLKPVVEFMTWNFCMQVGLGSGADVAESRCGRCGGAAVLLFDVARL